MPLELGRRLIAAGLVVPEDIEAALFLSVLRGIPFTRALLDRGAITEAALEEELDKGGDLAMPLVGGVPQLVDRLPRHMCRRLGAIPTRLEPGTGTVEVAASDPLDPHIAAEFAFHLGAPIRIVRASISAIEEAIRRIEPDDAGARSLDPGRLRRATPPSPHGSPESVGPPPSGLPFPLTRLSERPPAIYESGPSSSDDLLAPPLSDLPAPESEPLTEPEPVLALTRVVTPGRRVRRRSSPPTEMPRGRFGESARRTSFSPSLLPPPLESADEDTEDDEGEPLSVHDEEILSLDENSALTDLKTLNEGSTLTELQTLSENSALTDLKTLNEGSTLTELQTLSENSALTDLKTLNEGSTLTELQTLSEDSVVSELPTLNMESPWSRAPASFPSGGFSARQAERGPQPSVPQPSAPWPSRSQPSGPQPSAPWPSRLQPSGPWPSRPQPSGPWSPSAGSGAPEVAPDTSIGLGANTLPEAEITQTDASIAASMAAMAEAEITRPEAGIMAALAAAGIAPSSRRAQASTSTSVSGARQTAAEDASRATESTAAPVASPPSPVSGPDPAASTGASAASRASAAFVSPSAGGMPSSQSTPLSFNVLSLLEAELARADATIVVSKPAPASEPPISALPPSELPTLPLPDPTSVLEALREAKTRDEVVTHALIGLRLVARRVAVFAVRKDSFRGLACNAEFADEQAFRALIIPITQPSVLAMASSMPIYLGTIAETAANAELQRLMHRSSRDVAAIAARVGGRPVMMLLADELGDTMHGTRRMADLAHAVGDALSRLIGQRH